MEENLAGYPFCSLVYCLKQVSSLSWFSISGQSPPHAEYIQFQICRDLWGFTSPQLWDFANVGEVHFQWKNYYFRKVVIERAKWFFDSKTGVNEGKFGLMLVCRIQLQLENEG